MIARLASRSAELATRRPRTVLAFACAATLLALWSMALWLRVEADPENLVADDLPFMQAYEAWKAAMPQLRRGTIVVIDAPTPEIADEVQRSLGSAMAARPELFRGLYLPGADDVFARAAALYLPVPELQSLLDDLARAQPALAALARAPDLEGLAEARVLLGEDCAVAGAFDTRLARAAHAVTAGVPPAWSWQQALLGEAAPPSRRLILYRGALDDSDAEVTQAARTELAALVAGLRLAERPGVSVRATGRGALSAEEVERGLDDLSLAGAASCVAIVLVLLTGLRSGRATLAAVLTLGAGLIWTGGIAAALYGTLNLLSAAFAVLFVGLGIDVLIHLLLRRTECGMTAATRQLATPLALCAITTAVGFLAFVPTDYRGLAELGTVAAIGMAIAWLAAFTMLPALLAVLEPRFVARPARVAGTSGGGRGRNIALAICGVTLLLGLAALPPALRLGFDFNTLNLQDPDAPSVRALRDLQDDGLATPRALFLVADDAGEAATMAARLRALPSVADVRTLLDAVPADQNTKLVLLGDAGFRLWPLFDPAMAPPLDDAARRAAVERLAGAAVCGDAAPAILALADAPDRAAAFERTVAGSLPEAMDLLEALVTTGPIALPDLPPALLERLVAEDGRLSVTVLPRGPLVDTEAVARFVNEVTAIYPSATGQPALEAGVGAIVATAFREAILYALVAVTLVLAVLLRRGSDVVLALLPLVLSALFTAATATALGLSLNYANVIVIPLLFGLGVDNGIHMVSRWRKSATVGDLLASSTARAVLLSGLTTLASFASLAFVGQRAIASLGVLLSIALLWLLLTTLVVLPAVIALLRPKTPGDGVSAGNP